MMVRALIFIGILLLLPQCNSTMHLDELMYDNSNRLEGVEADEELADMISPYQSELAETMDEVLGEVAKDLVKEKPESTLGNLLADATRFMAEDYLGKPIDIGIVNYGGMRIPQLSKGDLTLRTAYELMPFDNYVVVLDIDGATLQDFCNAVAVKGGWPVSGLSFQLKEGKAVNVLVNELPLDKSKQYALAISDYIANGGDNMSMLKSLPRVNTNELLREAFIDYFQGCTKNGDFIDAELEGRIYE